MQDRKLQKFRGWVVPEKKRHAQFLGSAVGLRQVAHVVSKSTPPPDVCHERIVYVGCIHGGNENIFERLKLLIENPPDYLIFTGDITGTPEMEKLKKHFYDEKQKNNNLFSKGPVPVTSLQGKQPILTKGVYPDEVGAPRLVPPMHDTNHISYDLISKFNYFGDWAATLLKVEREKLLLGLKESAEKLLLILQRIKKNGVNIILLEGNWDNPEISGVRRIAGNDIKNVFNTSEFFRKHGFQFIDKLKCMETETTLHIFLPYITLLNFAELLQGEINAVQKLVEKVKNQGKTIIMVGHAEANWRMHHLYQKNPVAYGERGRVIGNFGRAMALFCPHEVIYPHQHARIRDERGELVDPDSKYLLHISRDGVRLVEDVKATDLADKNIIATYVPLGFLAEEDFVKYETKVL
jgi:Icc-related predicted phosphoesterase